jgi:putative DNA primase/helicase
MLRQAQPYLLRHPIELDSHDYVIVLNNAELDLGAPRFEPSEQAKAEDEPGVEERPHARETLSTRVAAVDYDPAASCPRWLLFLQEILPDIELRLFVQRWFGYCLTGDVSEQALLCCYGTGANGKSTLLEVVGEILGDYAVTVPIETFLHDDRKSGAQATPDIARLPGARLVLSAEPEVGARMSESTVKRITGGDKVNARRLFQEQFEFRPKFKLVISFNTKPSVRGQDEGIWRRLLMLPFKTFIPDGRRDRHLKQKLLAERVGIFNWMLDGFRLWREQGLNPPAAVKEATEAYRAESDPIGQFMEQATVRREGGIIPAADLYVAYQAWCSANGLEPVSKNLLGRRVRDKGYVSEKAGGFMVYLNLELAHRIAGE